MVSTAGKDIREKIKAGKKVLAQIVCICFIAGSFFECAMQSNEDIKKDTNNDPPAVINFFNVSSFKVDIYKNLNPEYFDSTTLVCSVNPGSTYKASVYASIDQQFDDTFYIRYKVLLANSYETGTSNIYVDAQRDLSNISMVVESGKTYTKTIPQPQTGQLKFINGYLKIQNMGSNQVQITRGYEFLHKMNDGGIYLNPGSNMGYYAIPFSFYDTALTITQLKAFSGSSVDFPSFSMERGKIYSFTVNGNTVTGPAVSTIDPMKQ